MDGIPGYDAWKLRTPEDDAAEHYRSSGRRHSGNAGATIILHRYDPESGSEVEMKCEVEGSIHARQVDDFQIIQPIGPQFEVTAEEEEEAQLALLESWEDSEPDYPEREDY